MTNNLRLSVTNSGQPSSKDSKLPSGLLTASETSFGKCTFTQSKKKQNNKKEQSIKDTLIEEKF